MRRNLAVIDRHTGSMIGRPLSEAMAHGIENDMIFGGLCENQIQMQGLCVAQTIQNCLVSTRRVTWDGRVFRYSLSGARCDTFIANCFHDSIGKGAGDVGIEWSVLPDQTNLNHPAEDARIGDTIVTMTNQGGHTIAEDGLFGGLLVLNVSVGTNNHTMQLRRITGNSSATLNGLCVISFAEPLVRVLTKAAAYAYCMPSPYNHIQAISGLNETGKVSACGYAGGEVDVTGKFHWEQTWGIISASLYGTEVGKTQYFRDVVFRYDGNLIPRDGTGIDGLQGQRAGHIIDNNGADNGATLIMLQLDK